MASLRVVRGLDSGRRFDLTGEHTIIGRQPDCDVCVPITSVSRRHALVVRRDGRYFLQDLDSLSGTRLNGRPTRGLSPLRDGDRIRIADFEAAFESPAQPLTDREWSTSSDSQAMLACLRENVVASRSSARRWQCTARWPECTPGCGPRATLSLSPPAIHSRVMGS
jgi:pSer/pThr/pTyr-binding forkhead associated (FHA) protein